MPELEEDQPDIALHMPLLEDLASKAAVILELGVGKGNGSTRAFARGIAKSPREDKLYVSVDFDADRPHECPDLPYWHMVYGRTEDPRTAAKVFNIIGGRKVDVIFIDTHHTYEQMQAELALWGSFASKETVWLAHDIQMFGSYNHMTDAIKDYCVEHPEWEYVEITPDSHGLGMMRWRS